MLLAMTPWLTFAQQTAIQGNTLSWNGEELARLRETDPDAELHGFELVKRDGTLLFCAYPSNKVPDDGLVANKTVYACLFQGVSEPVYLPLAAANAQEDLRTLLTGTNLIKDGGIDAQGVHHLRKKHGLLATETNTLRLVERDRTGPLALRKTGEIVQEGVLIGTVKPQGNAGGGLECYAVELPDGQRVATITFAGGDAALEFTIETSADNFWHPVRREYEANGKFEPGADSNATALLRILPWLVQKGYL